MFVIVIMLLLQTALAVVTDYSGIIIVIMDQLLLCNKIVFSVIQYIVSYSLLSTHRYITAHCF